MSKLTDEEELECARKALAAFRAGDYEEGEKNLKRIPVDPSIATIMKEVSGVKSIEERIAKGYDFLKVEEKYGKDWLYK